MIVSYSHFFPLFLSPLLLRVASALPAPPLSFSGGLAGRSRDGWGVRFSFVYSRVSLRLLRSASWGRRMEGDGSGDGVFNKRAAALDRAAPVFFLDFCNKELVQ